LKKIDFITALGEIKETIKEEEVQYFDQDFLIKRFSGLSNDDIKMNKSYVEKAEKEGKEAAPAEGGESEGESAEEESAEESIP